MNSEAGRPPTVHRADIQALRAVAVVLVVLYHAGRIVPGGFVGVDVFFVLSGYVITRSLLRELETTGTVSLRNFYLRRIRRLLPALGLMLTVTMLLSLALAPIPVMQIATRTGAAAALVNANTYLAIFDSSGYFGTDSELNPLLHTWSLSVEEQFYLLFPFLILAAWLCSSRVRIRKTASVVLVLAVLCALSFTLSIYLTTYRENGQTFAFYLSPTRAWEFGAGALLATAAPMTSRLSGKLVVSGSLLGLLVLVYASVTFNSETPFPGTAAILPVVGTSLLIAAGENGSSSTIGKILSWRPIQSLGDMSYSWYLWHWPCIVFAEAFFHATQGVSAAAAVISLLPAWLAYNLVETPIRRRKGVSSRRTMRLALVSVAGPLAAAVVLAVGYTEWADSHVGTQLAQHADLDLGCPGLVPTKRLDAHPCYWPAEGSLGLAVLVGDSNAGHLTESFVAAAANASMDAAVINRSNCGFVDAWITDAESASHDDACRSFVTDVTETLRQAQPDFVAIASASDRYIGGPDFGLSTLETSAVQWTPEQKAIVWQRALQSTIEQIAQGDTAVAVVETVPRVLTWEPSETAAVRLLYGTETSITRRDAESQRLHAVTADRAAAEASGAETLDLFPLLCVGGKEGTCSTHQGDTWLYRDPTHISVSAAEDLAPAFEALLLG